MRKGYRLSLFFLIVVACGASGCARAHGRVLHPSPGLLARTTPEMQTAGFWISRHPLADKVILSSEDIFYFNQKVREELGSVKDLCAWPPAVPGEGLRLKLQEGLTGLEARGLVLLDGAAPGTYWTKARQAMNLEAIPSEIPRRYGLVVRYTGQRFLPMDEGLYARAQDTDFDELQNSALDTGTPVVVLHQSSDGEWLWVESPFSFGWVRAHDVAAAADDQVKSFGMAPFVVVAAAKADVYLDRAMTKFAGSLQMGARLPLAGLEVDHAQVALPLRQVDGTAALVPGFMAAADVHEGYLPYTPRQVLTQAFKMLHQPYGWGGMYGAQDCSRFLQQVFATAGIDLPRDSKDQIRVGALLASWEAGVADTDKTRALDEGGVGGMTLLGMKGHIMLYLGSVDGRPYAIHSAWAYRTPGPAGDEIHVMNRVVVSDLGLGEGSQRGSLLNRLNAARIVR